MVWLTKRIWPYHSSAPSLPIIKTCQVETVGTSLHSLMAPRPFFFFGTLAPLLTPGIIYPSPLAPPAYQVVERFPLVRTSFAEL